MRVVVVGESPYDRAAVLALSEIVVGQPLVPLDGPPLIAHGADAAIKLVTAVVHNAVTEGADGLIVVVDGDDTTAHKPDHRRGQLEESCRLCRIHAKIDRALHDMRFRLGNRQFRTAAGIAIPAIEAWALLGTDPRASEAAWALARAERRSRHIRPGLKERLYGAVAPPSNAGELLTDALVRVARNSLSDLEVFFPTGFKPLVDDLRRWRPGGSAM